VHYVQALEEGEISYLPSPVQGRGMLSNYASFLGLNTETILLRFADGLQASLYHRQNVRSPKTAASSPEQAQLLPARPSQLRRFFSMDMFISGMLMLFLLGFIVWGVLRITDLRSHRGSSPTAPPVSEILLSTQGGLLSTQQTLQPTLLSTSAITSTGGSSLAITPVPELPTEAPVAAGPTPGIQNAPVQLYVVAQRRVWMRVTVDGEVSFQGRVMPGSAYSYAANEDIVLLTGDAGGLQVYFNQQNLGVLGGLGEVAQRVFTVAGMQTATPAALPTGTSAPTGTVTPTPTPTRTGMPPTATQTPKP
jgi:cytoskeletal protein RodZ